MLSDLRLGLRRLRLAPVFSITIIAVLALGIGANTTLFSVMYTLLSRPLDVPEMERLTVATPRFDGQPYLSNEAEASMWRTHSRTHDAWGVSRADSAVLADDSETRQVALARTDADYLQLLGAKAQLGRLYTAEECRQDLPVVVLGYGLWRSGFGGDPNVLGRAVRLDGRVRTVVGVLTPGFDLPQSTQVFIPYVAPAPGTPERLARGLLVVGRRVASSTLVESDLELRGLAVRLGTEEPTQLNWSVEALPLRRQLLLDLDGTLRQRLLFLVGATLGLLLLTGLNVGNMLLARTLARSREFAICAALGGSAGRIVSRVAWEIATLAAVGGGLGVLLAAYLTPVLLGASPVKALALADRFSAASLDARVAAFALATTALAAVLAGIPALRFAFRRDLLGALQAGGSKGGTVASGRWRDRLVLLQVALCVALLSGAGLLVRGFERLNQTRLGFEPRGVSSVRVAMPVGAFPDQAARWRFLEQAVAKLRQLPDVAEAAMVSTMPMHLDGWGASFVAENGAVARAEQPLQTEHRLVSADYFRVMGSRLLEGRLIETSDRAGAPRVVVVSESFAREVWPGESAIGKRVRRTREPGGWMTVVGVIETAKEDRSGGIAGNARVWYLPYAQAEFPPPVHLVVRTKSERPLSLAEFTRSVRELSSQVAVFEAASLPDQVGELLAPQRFAAGVMGGFAVLGAVVAALGIFGVSHYLVGLRQREFGIRLALGAKPSAVQWLVLSHSFRNAAAGAVVGVAAAIALGRLIESRFAGVTSNDLLVYACSLLIALLMALGAGWVPARRAARTDPKLSWQGD